MVITIYSDSDLPKSLNTSAKQAKKARELAQSCYGLSAKKARGPPMQGFFSRTVIVTLQNGEDVVIQFRPEPLELGSFQIAQKALGSVVPTVKLLEDDDLRADGIWVYFMNCIPGKTWLDGARGRASDVRVTFVRSLGRILSKGNLGSDSAPVIEQTIRPHLDLILSSEDPEIRKFHDTAEILYSRLHQLEGLPLFVSHFDLNDVNILVDENCEVSGIVDWELSTPLPLGMGFHRIHTLAGEYSEGEFYMPPEFEEAERGFWDEVFRGVPEGVGELMRTNPEAVQTSFALGTLLDAFQLDEGKLGPYNPVVVKALAKLLTYRIPVIRGEAVPYAV